MPRGLPTPVNSTDIKGKDGASQFPAQGVQMSFELPPPAITHSTPTLTGIDSRPSSASAKSSSASSYHPTSPKSPVYSSTAMAAKRRQSNSQAGSGKNGSATAQFALPPPPTRSRKIIQMKPRQTERAAPNVEVSTTANTSVSKGTPEKGKRKQPSSTSVAGRKIARKTAHSLIERRRRSKMNEEFGVLKNMIPACTGEMHKLAILQASIDYIRYLEDCVSQLKAQTQDPTEPHNRTPTPATSTNFSRPPSTLPSVAIDNSKVDSYATSTTANQDENEDEDEDVDMEDDVDDEAISPAYTTYSSHRLSTTSPQTRSYSHTKQSHQPSVSPVASPQDHHTPYRNQSEPQKTSINTNIQSSHNRMYSFSPNTSQTPITTSATTSPNFGPLASPFIYPSSATSYTHSPQIYHSSSSNPPVTIGSEYTYIRSTSICSSTGLHSQLTSPALAPVRDRDRDSPYLRAIGEPSVIGGGKDGNRGSASEREREEENTAMAALLMLNSDRRGIGTRETIGGGNGGTRAGIEEKGRGNLSVRDLLSA